MKGTIDVHASVGQEELNATVPARIRRGIQGGVTYFPVTKIRINPRVRKEKLNATVLT